MNNEVKAVRFDINRCIRVLFRKFYIVILMVMITTGLGVLYVQNTPKANVYVANASIYSASYGSYSASLQGGNAMINYAQVITSKKVCNRAALLLGDNNISAEMIQGMITVSVPEDSYVLNVYAYSTIPKYCISVVNAVAEAFVLEMSTITGSAVVQVLDKAEFYSLSSSARNEKITTCLFFGAFGFILSCLLIMVPVLFSKKIVSLESNTLHDKIEVLGLIPKY